MASTKIYGIFGRSTAVVRVPAGRGKAYVEAVFDRGVPTPGPNYRPATFSTSDPAVQAIMDNSPLNGRLYRIYRIYEDPEPGAPEARKPKRDPVTSVEPVEGVETREDAVAYLKARGVKATDLRSAQSIQNAAARLGVSFPNLSL